MTLGASAGNLKGDNQEQQFTFFTILLTKVPMSRKIPNPKIPVGVRIKELRECLGITQQQLGEQMHVSASFICQIESGQSQPSPAFLDLLLCKFRLDPEEFLEDVIYRDSLEEKSKKYLSPLGVAMSLAAPVNPLLAGAVAAGVGATTIILRMCDAYGAKSEQGLAKKLSVGKTTISNWKTRNNIPKKYLVQAAQDTGRSIEWILGNQLTTYRSILQDTVTHILLIQAEKGYTLTAEAIGKLTAHLYDEFVKTGEVDKGKIQEFLDVAASVMR